LIFVFWTEKINFKEKKMKTNIFSKLAVLLLMLMILITVSCKKKISKEDLEFRVGQSISEYFLEEILKQYGSLVSRERIGELARFETKVSLIKEAENRYMGEAIVEYWKPDQHGGDGPGTKEAEEKHSIVVIVDPDDGSFRWEMQN
jgi:hypothetical protein